MWYGYLTLLRGFSWQTTRRIFTADRRLAAIAPIDEYRAVLEEFPAYSSVLLRLAIVNLRTVIVTAAVHWGFSSKLRLAADLSL